MEDPTIKLDAFVISVTSSSALSRMNPERRINLETLERKEEKKKNKSYSNTDIRKYQTPHIWKDYLRSRWRETASARINQQKHGLFHTVRIVRALIRDFDTNILLKKNGET